MCVFVCLSMWYAICEHEYKNVRAELTWRFLIATIKTHSHISKSLFSCAKNSKGYAKSPEFSPALGLIVFWEKSVATNLR